jgi:hypothetical protein
MINSSRDQGWGYQYPPRSMFDTLSCLGLGTTRPYHYRVNTRSFQWFFIGRCTFHLGLVGLEAHSPTLADQATLVMALPERGVRKNITRAERNHIQTHTPHRDSSSHQHFIHTGTVIMPACVGPADTYLLGDRVHAFNKRACNCCPKLEGSGRHTCLS